MQDQHAKIAGYRDLSQVEIDAMNEINALGIQIGALVDKLMATEGLDKRWIAIGKTEAQQAIMALVRSVAQPTTF